MGNLLDQLGPGSRIAVIRLRSMGDCVLTTPALALLKAHRPDLEIRVVVEPRFRALFEGNPDITSLHSGVTAADLALNVHGGTRSMALTLTTGARLRAGFAHHRYSFLYSVKIPRAQEILRVERTVHTAEHLASAMFWMGVPQTEIPRAKLHAGAPPDLPPYAVIHPFASAPGKTWPAERFIAIAQRLREGGLEPVFLAGPGDESGAFSRFSVWRNRPLDEVKNLLAGAQLFAGNDSGPAHIAAAFGIPSLVLFGDSDPAVWGPWRTEAQVLSVPGGIGDISVGQAIGAIEALKARTLRVRA